MGWTSLIAGLVSFLNKAAPWLVAFVAYLKGKQAAVAEAELKTAKKEKEYLEIEVAPRDESQRMKDGTW